MARGYRSHLKEWPIERWLALGRALGKAGFEIVLTGGPSERSRNDDVVKRAAEELGGDQWINCAGASMDQTIAILRRSQLTVSVNTGIMHVAAVIGAPVIGLHGPTSQRRWGPLGENAVAISPHSPGCGYLDLGFEYPAQCECMSRITVEQVWDSCKVFIGMPVIQLEGI